MELNQMQNLLRIVVTITIIILLILLGFLWVFGVLG